MNSSSCSLIERRSGLRRTPHKVKGGSHHARVLQQCAAGGRCLAGELGSSIPKAQLPLAEHPSPIHGGEGGSPSTTKGSTIARGLVCSPSARQEQTQPRPRLQQRLHFALGSLKPEIAEIAWKSAPRVLEMLRA